MITSANFKSDTIYQGESLQFGLSFENKGKNTVEQPRIVMFFVDPLYRVWNVWNESMTYDMFTRGCNFEYRFPQLDQKIIGTWRIFVLLYDETESVPVSYLVKEFTVTDAVAGIFSTTFLIIMVTVLVVIITMLLLRVLYGAVTEITVRFREVAKEKRERAGEEPKEEEST